MVPSFIPLTSQTDDEADTCTEVRNLYRSPRVETAPPVQKCATAIKIPLLFGLVCAFGIAVVFWMKDMPAKLEQVPGGGAGPTLIREVLQSYSCSGHWPEPQFHDGWNVYCSKKGSKAWAMNTACSYAGWEWEHKRLADAKSAALAACNKANLSLTCSFFDIDGNKCSGHAPLNGALLAAPPRFVRWGPPYIGSFKVTQQGRECRPSHCSGGSNADAVDFGTPRGTDIIAGRAGTVWRIADGHGEGGNCQHFAYQTNAVVIKMADGTYDEYIHLLAGGIAVKPGDKVVKGQLLAKSGNSGCSSGPHLHVHTMQPNGRNTVEIKWTFPCGPNNQADLVVRREQIMCNDLANNCQCTSANCKTWPDDQQVKNMWNKFCAATWQKAWYMDRVCGKWSWHSTDQQAKQNCGAHCVSYKSLGMKCPNGWSGPPPAPPPTPPPATPPPAPPPTPPPRRITTTAKVMTTTAKVQGSTTCAVGDAVVAVYAGNGRRYPCKIASINSDGTMLVNWNDGDQLHRKVKPRSVFKNNKPCPSDCAIGDHVVAPWAGDNKQYPCTIDSVNNDGSITVNWSDGDPSHRIIPFAKVLRAGKACNGRMSLCKVGDAATAPWAGNGKTYSCTIASINKGNTMTVNWKDGDPAHRNVPISAVRAFPKYGAETSCAPVSTRILREWMKTMFKQHFQ